MAATCAMPTSRPAAQEAIKQRVPARNRRQVAIDDDFGEIGPQNIGPDFEQNRAQSDPGLPFIGTQILEQPLHQAAVISFT